MANFAFGRFLRQGDWKDIILRGPAETAFTGPVLTDCHFPGVLVAKAMSHGTDLDLVLVNGEDAGPQIITIEQLVPGEDYMIEGCDTRFKACEDGKAVVTVVLDGRTPVHIVRTAS